MTIPFEKLLIEDVLVKLHILTEAQVKKIKQQAEATGKDIITLALEEGKIDREQAVKASAISLGVPYVNINGQKIPKEVTSLIPKETAETYKVIPLGLQNDRINVALTDPNNIQLVDFVSRKTGHPVNIFMASEDSITFGLQQYGADITTDVKQALRNVEVMKKEDEEAKKKEVNPNQIQSLVQDAPITKALNTIMEYAVKLNASDIHIEPREDEVKIRYRIDGILQDTMSLPKAIEPALISRIKILSNLKIDEHRVPQDGHIDFRQENINVDLRIAIAPITWGEQVVIRILDRSNSMLTLNDLGLHGEAYEKVKKGVHKPHGMVLCTGPTGSGKSTTLYAALQEINTVGINIITLEDPVEFRMSGINQIQVNDDVGLTFASGLRSILRMDPNVIMVGEVRDSDTADLAVQAALTGHTVLSTLHTNSAAGVLPRLLDMKIEPFLIASTVNTVMAQRLVRMICDNCRVEYKASESAVIAINNTIGKILPKEKKEAKKTEERIGLPGLPLYNENAYTLYKGKGCQECQNGFKGRRGIFEVYDMSPALESLVTENATSSQIQQEAIKQGMLTMKQDGYLKALVGLTTLEEVSRVAADF